MFTLFFFGIFFFLSQYRSTDSTLKLWNIRDGECVRTYTGHVNEKNFVGLSSNSDWISCGSENNAVYTYYKSFRSPLACVKFGGFDPLTVSLITFTGFIIQDALVSIFYLLRRATARRKMIQANSSARYAGNEIQTHY
jgi:WD40 repeat protein